MTSGRFPRATAPTSEQLLNQLVQKVLREEYNFKSDPIYQAFVQPFTDVLATAKAETEKTFARGIGETQKFLEQTLATIVPFIPPNIAKIDEKVQERLRGIDDRYRDVYERTWNTIGSKDAQAFTFLLNPTVGISLLKKGPEAALGVLEMLTGGHPKITSFKERWKGLVGLKAAPRGPSYSMGGDGYYEHLRSLVRGREFLFEDEAAQQQQQMLKELEALLKDPEIHQKAANSPATQYFKQLGTQIIGDLMEPIESLKTFDDLTGLVDANTKKQLESEVPPGERAKVANEALPTIKQGYKTALEAMIKQMSGGSSKDKQAVAKTLG
jgi:hypothetical protein